MIDDDFDFDQPVTRIPQIHKRLNYWAIDFYNKLNNTLLQWVVDHMHNWSSRSVSSSLKIRTLQSWPIKLEYESDEPIANDVLNLLFFWQMANEKEAGYD